MRLSRTARLRAARGAVEAPAAAGGPERESEHARRSRGKFLLRLFAGVFLPQTSSYQHHSVFIYPCDTNVRTYGCPAPRECRVQRPFFPARQSSVSTHCLMYFICAGLNILNVTITDLLLCLAYSDVPSLYPPALYFFWSTGAFLYSLATPDYTLLMSSQKPPPPPPPLPLWPRLQRVQLANQHRCELAAPHLVRQAARVALVGRLHQPLGNQGVIEQAA